MSSNNFKMTLNTYNVFFQTPFTAVGSWFALSQSAGVVGAALATKGAVGACTSVITYATLGLLSNCEKE